MTNAERQILVNQVAIMSTLMHIIKNGNLGSEQDIADLGKCSTMTYDLVHSETEKLPR